MRKLLITPHGILVLTVTISFLAWLFPDFGVLYKGFVTPQPFFDQGLVVLLLWYGSIFGVSWLLYLMGKRHHLTTTLFDRYVPLNDVYCYLVLSIVAWVGTGYTYYVIAQYMSFQDILDSIQGGTGNSLKMTLYLDYAVGPLSLRYVTSLAGGLALYRFWAKISHSPIDFLNVLALLIVALISSRLSLVMGVLISWILYVSNFPGARTKWWRIILVGPALFLLLGLYNLSRNGNFYGQRGNTDFFSSSFGELLAYLGAPFQGSLAAGNNFQDWVRGADPHTFSQIGSGLETNSALLEIPTLDGDGFFITALVTCGAAAFVIGYLSSQRGNHLMLVPCVLLYCFSEIWRTFIFYRGIIMVLLSFSLISPFCMVALKGYMNQKKQERQNA
jgi:hypothetical protein